MNSPEPVARHAPSGSAARRIAAAVTLGFLVFAALWVMVFDMVVSMLIGTACCAMIVAAGSASDVIDMLLDAVASALLGIAAIIAAILGAIFSLFGL